MLRGVGETNPKCWAEWTSGLHIHRENMVAWLYLKHVGRVTWPGEDWVTGLISLWVSSIARIFVSVDFDQYPIYHKIHTLLVTVTTNWVHAFQAFLILNENSLSCDDTDTSKYTGPRTFTDKKKLGLAKPVYFMVLLSEEDFSILLPFSLFRPVKLQ